MASLLLPPAPQWAAWCAAHPRARPLLWAPAACLQVVTLDPQLPLTARELALHARGVFAHYLGEPASRAPLAVWRAGQHRGACLLREQPLQAMLDQAASHGVRPRGLWPLWAGQLALAWEGCPALRRAPKALLVVVEGPLVTAITLRAGCVRAVQLHRLDEASPAALADWLAGEPSQGPVWAAGHGLAGAAAPTSAWQAWGDLHSPTPVLAQAPPKGPMTQWPDFLSLEHHARLRRGAWAMAGAAAAILVGAAVPTAQAWQSLQAARALPPLPAAGGAGGRAAGAAAAQNALARAHNGWPGLLSAVEQLGAQHQVQWLAFEHAAAGGQVRLRGRAPGPAQATALATALSHRAGWHQVLIERMGDSGDADMAFELSANWMPLRQELAR